MRGEFEASHGGVARVPQAREVLEVRAARLSSANIDVVVQALDDEESAPKNRPGTSIFICR